MKEFIHKIRQIFMSTRVIENRMKYQFLCNGCVFIHFIFAVLMLIGKVYFLVAINVAAVLLYMVLGYVLAPKEKYKIIFVASFFEIMLNVFISSIMLGAGYDFKTYTLSLIPGAFYMAHTWPEESKNKYDISIIPLFSTFVIGIMYVTLDILQSVVPPTYVGELPYNIKTIIHYFNIFIAVFMLLAFSILFALEVRYIQKLLSDENSRLDKIASSDPLTKALNRRSLYNIINDEISSNEHLQFGFIILDIDDFKKVNDTYGHVVGDRVLVKVASVIRENLREGDYFCRWGGEEFLLMVHGEEDVYGIVAERIREGIEKEKFQGGPTCFSVTATLGVSAYQVGVQIRTLVDLADQKMYFGKKHGKNQVVK